jgi:hypothetical protein
LQSVLGSDRTRRLLPPLLLVLPAKLLITGRSISWSEIAGAVIARTCWYFLSEYERRTAVVAGLIVSLLILRGLVPYHWSSVANSFSWVPFRASLEANRNSGLLTVIQKMLLVWIGSLAVACGRVAACTCCSCGGTAAGRDRGHSNLPSRKGGRDHGSLARPDSGLASWGCRPLVRSATLSFKALISAGVHLLASFLHHSVTRTVFVCQRLELVRVSH